MLKAKSIIVTANSLDWKNVAWKIKDNKEQSKRINNKKMI